MNTAQKLTQLRALMRSHGLQGYMQPVHDAFMSEYPPSCNQRVEWLSGFSGSAGMVVVLEEKAALFTDGRYTLQAAKQLDGKLFEVINSADMHPSEWVAKAKIGYDPMLFTKPMLAKYAGALACDNLVDALWSDRPAAPASKLFLHHDLFAGESAASKCARMAKIVAEKNADALLLTAPESVNWLLNMRARDVECTPLALCTALLKANGSVVVFIDPARALGELKNVEWVAAAQMGAYLQSLQGQRVMVDEDSVPVAYIEMLAGATLVNGSDPCLLARAKKNAAQLAGIRAAHVSDGAAIVKLLYWLEQQTQVSELEVVEKLLQFRQQHAEFIEPSFATIAGSGPHGAIVHYRADHASNRHLQNGELFLLDSGGQYPQGTTDITRTIAIGKPTPEHIDRFTRVLRGHIALANATFPKGTRGSQLDALARQFLWQAGLDYDHGTGHGVGQFLGVHEGPHRISKRGNDAPLEPGMVVSNEPGYYKNGEYGIRIENLVTVIEYKDGFLGFGTLTCAPIDKSLIDVSKLSPQEKNWFNDYHRWVSAMLTPLLPEAEQAWLETACAPL